MRLTIKKGSFEQDPVLGSELYKLKHARGKNLSRLAMSYVQEALLSMPEVTVTDVAVKHETTDVITLAAGLSLSQNQYRLEVDVI